MLNITNAAAILARNEMTGKIEFDLNRCPPLCPNLRLPYAEINVTIPIADGTEPAIMRLQSGPKGDLWIREDGPNHRWIFFERWFIFYLQHVHAGLMLLAQDYLSLQDRSARSGWGGQGKSAQGGSYLATGDNFGALEGKARQAQEMGRKDRDTQF